MNVRGRTTLDVPRDRVFDAIFDPTTLLGIIPGCSEIERVDDVEYRGRITLRLPGMVGVYGTVVRVVETERPVHGRLDGEVVGSLGTIKGSATFRLTDSAGRTTVEYEGQASIGGPLARLDTRFAEGLAGSLIKQGLGNLESRLQGEPASESRRAAPTVVKEGSR
jgi:carbon monoxide dehydrogenase subunit G